jgi:uncharacterized membrane protein HdeD (DUF308 family)
MESAFERAQKATGTQLTKFRWALGINGLFAVAAGVVILVWPGISLFALTILFGAWTAANGVVGLIASLSGSIREDRGWLAFTSLLSLALGIAVLVWPSISALALLYVIGVYAFGLGILAVFASFRLPLEGRAQASMALTGLTSIVFAIVIFAKPGAGALAVLALIAAFALVTGVTELVVAIGGEKLLERKVTKTFSKAGEQLKTTPHPTH